MPRELPDAAGRDPLPEISSPLKQAVLTRPRCRPKLNTAPNLKQTIAVSEAGIFYWHRISGLLSVIALPRTGVFQGLAPVAAMRGCKELVTDQVNPSPMASVSLLRADISYIGRPKPRTVRIATELWAL